MTTLAVKEAARKLAIKIECQEDLYYYTRYMFLKRKGFKWIRNWHHKVICDKLMDVYNGKCRRLIINLPPRYGKTDISVISFISWCLGKNPDAEFIHTSYTKTLATTNSWQTKTIVESDYYQEIFPVELRSDSKRKDEWRTTSGGCVYASGAEGTITGYGAGKMRPGFGGAFIVDDPHKAGEAHRATSRAEVINFFQTTLESRMNSRETPVIIIMQRLHEDDLCGWLLGGGNGEEWDHICIPAINDEDEALWPLKHDRDELARMEKHSPYVFAGQYLQIPSPLGGGIFKDAWWKFYKILPKIQYSIIVADTAMKEKEQHDFSAFAVFSYGEDKNLYISDFIRGKWEAPDLEMRIVAFWNKHKANPDLRLRSVNIEDKASGIGLIQKIKRKHKIPVIPIKRDTRDKISRAMGIVDYIASGYVYLQEGASWVSDLLSETSVFPNGKHDDQVDVVTDGIDQIYNSAKEYRMRII